LYNFQASSNPFNGNVYNLLPFFCQFLGNEAEQVSGVVESGGRDKQIGLGGVLIFYQQTRLLVSMK
jgi:hypothetical protein